MSAPNVYLHSNDDIREAMMVSLGGGGDDLAGDDSAGTRAAVAMLWPVCTENLIQIFGVTELAKLAR
jgi:hypothetical protein